VNGLEGEERFLARLGMTPQGTGTEAESSAFLFFLPTGKHGGLFEGFLGLLEGLGRVFHRLLGVLVSGLMIFLAVMRRGYAMGVRGKLVKLSGSLMRIIRHEILRSARITVALCGGDVHGGHSEVQRQKRKTHRRDAENAEKARGQSALEDDKKMNPSKPSFGGQA
jgi:hypothetical protein